MKKIYGLIVLLCSVMITPLHGQIPRADAGLSITQYHNGTIWDNNSMSQCTYYYDDEGNCKLATQKAIAWTFDQDTTYWLPYSRAEYTYNDEWQLIQLSTEDSIAGLGWILSSEAFYTYNEDGYQSSATGVMYTNGVGETYGEQQMFYTYNDLGQVEEDVLLIIQEGETTQQYKTIYEYDLDGNVTGTLEQYFDTDTDVWIDNRTTASTYEDGMLTLMLQQDWFPEQEAWYTTVTNEYFYGDDNLPDSLISNIPGLDITKWEFFYDENNNLVEEYTYYKSSEWQPWTIYGHGNYYDLCMPIAGVNEEEMSAPFTLYPNPGNELTITSELAGNHEVMIYDSKGPLVYAKHMVNINGSLTINETNSLPQGLYSVVLRKGDSVETLKWIKE